MVVEPAPVVPGEEDRSVLPSRSAHDGVDEARDIRLPDRDERRWVLAFAVVRHDPRHRRELSGAGVDEQLVDVLDVGELAVLVHGVERR